MAEIKNFGLTGVGGNVQLGKAGPRLKVNGAAVEVRNSADDSLTIFRGANAVTANDLVTLGQLNTTITNAISNISTDGFGLNLGDVAEHGDGAWTPGAVSLTNETKVSEAVDRLNEVLGMLVPSAPPSFPNANALTVTNTAGTSPLLASGATDNTGGSGISAGASVTRITAAGVNSNTFNDMGPGNTGTVSLLINGTTVGSKALTGTGDNSTTNGLVIADQKDYPVATPGFWKSIDVSVTNGAAQVGINKFRLSHSDAGQTGETFFVRDNVTAVPAITGTSVAQSAAGTVAYSSSVPHYNTGATLTVNASISNLSGQTYYGGSDPLVISGTNAIISSDTLTYATLGISLPIAANTTTATAISPVSVSIDGTNIHGMGQLQGVARNVNGASTTTTLSSTVILVKRGTAAASKIDELSVPVSGLGSSPNTNNALRVTQGSGDTPSGGVTAWDATASLETHDAAVVGGILKHDQTNYSTGYLPVGPDLSSGRSGAQYVTFSFNRTALSQFKINVTGTYAGCWVSMPGVSDNAGISPNALGGAWWNAMALYDGAGVPGESGDSSAGCASGAAMTGSTGNFTVTFGTQSSTNATGNEIRVRFRLNAGQSITALSFTN